MGSEMCIRDRRREERKTKHKYIHYSESRSGGLETLPDLVVNGGKSASDKKNGTTEAEGLWELGVFGLTAKGSLRSGQSPPRQ